MVFHKQSALLHCPPAETISWRGANRYRFLQAALFKISTKPTLPANRIKLIPGNMQVHRKLLRQRRLSTAWPTNNMCTCHCNSVPGCNTWTGFNINHPEFKDLLMNKLLEPHRV